MSESAQQSYGAQETNYAYPLQSARSNMSYEDTPRQPPSRPNRFAGLVSDRVAYREQASDGRRSKQEDAGSALFHWLPEADIAKSHHIQYRNQMNGENLLCFFFACASCTCGITHKHHLNRSENSPRQRAATSVRRAASQVLAPVSPGALLMQPCRFV